MLPLTIDSVLHNSEIPALPERYRRLLRAVDGQSPSCVSDILREDAGCSSFLLALVGSPLFHFAAPIGRVDDAVASIGEEQARDLMLAAVAVRLFAGVSPDIVHADAFWRHNVACGIVARTIAARLGEANVERYFLAGLLHDIGSLFLYRHIPERSLIQLLHERDTRAPLYELEREVLGFDHAALSGALAQEWELPEAVWAAVTHHHAPGSAVAYPREGAVLHVADLIAVALECGSSGEYCVPPLVPEAWDALGIAVAELPLLVEQVDHQLEAAFRIFLHDNSVCAGEI